MLRLIVLISITMVAFAANSLLTRMAISNQELGASSFAFIRLLSGTLVLIAIILIRSGVKTVLKARPNFNSVLGLSAYMVGFHYAYSTLDAGLGALILFGGVQLVMFSASIIKKESLPISRWLGMFLAMFGLGILFFPSKLPEAQPISGMFLMLLAAFGWGIYSLSGKTAIDPIARTMSNFIFTLPLVTIVYMFFPDTIPVTPKGIFLAICSGAVMTALGYALWYALLPSIDSTVASLVQLTVPVIALVMGVLLLDELITLLSMSASILVLGGVSLGLLGRKNMLQNNVTKS